MTTPRKHTHRTFDRASKRPPRPAPAPYAIASAGREWDSTEAHNGVDEDMRIDSTVRDEESRTHVRK